MSETMIYGSIYTAFALSVVRIFLCCLKVKILVETLQCHSAAYETIIRHGYQLKRVAGEMLCADFWTFEMITLLM